MKILITGISGFIGFHLTKELKLKGYKIFGIDKKSYKHALTIDGFFQGDILDKKISLKAMKDIDIIIHLAAEHQDFGISKEDYFSINHKGTINLLDCASELGIQKFIFYSSVAIYGLRDTKTTETSKPLLNNYYGASKYEAEKEVKNWQKSNPLNKAIIIRPTVVFGPNMNDFANIYRLIDQIAKNKFVKVGKLKNIKSLAYVENLVDATIYLLDKFTNKIDIYNYADQPHLFAEEIVNTIYNYLNIKIPVFRSPYYLTIFFVSIIDLIAKVTKINFPITAQRIRKINTYTEHDSSKIFNFGFKPRFKIDEGIKKSIEWYINK